MKRITLSIMLLAAFAATLLVPAASSADVTQCGRENTYAKFLQPQGGQVAATTQLGGVAYTIPGSPLPSMSFSTTGQIDVEIEWSCVKFVRLEVYKDGNPVAIHQNTWGLDCTKGIVKDKVNIGLDGGNYRFVLDGITCTGAPIKRTDDGGFVADPPLPVGTIHRKF